MPIAENRQEGSMIVDSSNLKTSELETEDPLIRELYNEIKTKNDEKMDQNGPPEVDQKAENGHPEDSSGKASDHKSSSAGDTEMKRE